ncbi:MAG: insulinase family protein [Chloroflexaceae bacterium]|nr:insulinase family protein [Chloroflexaceae bacterium]
MTNNPVQAHTLPNGMLVLTREMRNAPVTTAWIWYRVGSRNEPGGRTGISHWVEHMLFKGTPTMPPGTLNRLIKRNGGNLNGFTSLDYTAYYATLPADRIELAFRIESDRMINATFDPQEVEHERTVILAELEGYANYPTTWLDEAVTAAAFSVHPYHHPIIGYACDLRAMSRDDLYQHYQTYYMPNNAVLVLVGDFQTSGIMAQVERYFADLPVGPALPHLHAIEPEPQGERRVMVQRPGPAEYVQIAYLVPGCRDSDFAALTVLNAVLSGARSFGGGGVPTHRSARLYRALVETQLVSSASSSYMPRIDPHLFELHATVRSEHHADEIERALLHEIERIQQDGIGAEELARISKQLRAQVTYGSESVTSQARLLGAWEVLDSYRRVDTLVDELTAVQAADVQRVAQTYLTARRRVVGHFVPTDQSQGDGQ